MSCVSRTSRSSIWLIDCKSHSLQEARSGHMREVKRRDDRTRLLVAERGRPSRSNTLFSFLCQGKSKGLEGFGKEESVCESEGKKYFPSEILSLHSFTTLNSMDVEKIVSCSA